MADFINTVDVIGDEALMDSIIDRSITEFHDETITTVGEYAFYGCNALAKVDVPNVTSIAAYSLYGCSGLYALVLRGSSVATLGNTYALTNSGIAKTIGYVYVPRALVDSYKAATNWSTYADQFRALEDYTVDGTVTGDLDETKI